MRLHRVLLVCGTWLPALALASFVRALMLSRQHDVLFDPPSALGIACEPSSGWWNHALLLMAVLCAASTVPVARGLLDAGADAVLAVLCGASILLVACYLAMTAAFPLPDPRHGGLGLNASGYALPVLGLFALRSCGCCRGGQWLLGSLSAAATALNALCIAHARISPGQPPMGLQVGLLGLACFACIAVLCHAVLPRRVRHRRVAMGALIRHAMSGTMAGAGTLDDGLAARDGAG